MVSKELVLGIHHLRMSWFSFRLLYLKALINIFTLIWRAKNKLLYQDKGDHLNWYRQTNGRNRRLLLFSDFRGKKVNGVYYEAIVF